MQCNMQLYAVHAMIVYRPRCVVDSCEHLQHFIIILPVLKSEQIFLDGPPENSMKIGTIINYYHLV